MTGTAADVPRRELAVHTDVSWVVPVGRRAQVAIFGGPSFFQVRQRLVTDVTVSSTYPFDTATFVSATTADASRSQVGFNVGVDVTRLIRSTSVSVESFVTAARRCSSPCREDKGLGSCRRTASRWRSPVSLLAGNSHFKVLRSHFSVQVGAFFSNLLGLPEK